MLRHTLTIKPLHRYILLLSLWLLWQPGVGQIPVTTASAPRPTLSTLAGLPLSFLPNQGQRAAGIMLESRTPQGTLLFGRNEVRLISPQTQATTLRWHFIGANPAPQVDGAEPLPGVVNVYSGDDSAVWRSGLPTYAAVTYRRLYPGIDLTYDGSQGLLKGTFTVAAGVDPGQIRWHYPETGQLTLAEPSGDLLIELPDQTILTEQAPVAWQEIKGRRVPVAVQFDLDPVEQTVGFTVGHYEAAYPLIIDPTLVYSTYLGGNGSDWAGSVAVDNAGNVYLTGYTYSTDLSTTGSSLTGKDDVFVMKINAAGTAVVYTTYLGGSESDQGYDLAVDNSGRVWLTGQTSSDDFPTMQPFQAVYGGSIDAFVAQLNPNGSLAFSSYIGGGGYVDSATALALDPNGDVHLTGTIWGGFLAKVSAQSYDLLYTRMIGGQDVTGNDIAVDQIGNIYVTGEVRSESWPVVNPVQAACGRYDQYTCSSDAFVLKLNPAADDILFNTYLGGSAAPNNSGTDTGRALTVDAAGNIYVSGETFAPDFPTAHAFQGNRQGEDNFADAFVAKLSPQGDGYELAYSSYLGGEWSEYVNGIAVDGVGNTFVTGYTDSTYFPTQNALQAQIGPGVCVIVGDTDRYCADAFVTQITSNGTVPFSTFLGGTGDDIGGGVAVDKSGNLYVAGRSESGGFPTTTNALKPNRGAYQEAFLVKMGGGSSGPGNPPPVGNFRVFLPLIIR